MSESPTSPPPDDDPPKRPPIEEPPPDKPGDPSTEPTDGEE